MIAYSTSAGLSNGMTRNPERIASIWRIMAADPRFAPPNRSSAATIMLTASPESPTSAILRATAPAGLRTRSDPMFVSSMKRGNVKGRCRAAAAGRRRRRGTPRPRVRASRESAGGNAARPARAPAGPLATQERLFARQFEFDGNSNRLIASSRNSLTRRTCCVGRWFRASDGGIGANIGRKGGSGNSRQKSAHSPSSSTQGTRASISGPWTRGSKRPVRSRRARRSFQWRPRAQG